MNENEIITLPPYVVNDANPIMGFAENIDWGTNLLKIPQIHSEFKLTGKGVKVAVIDTGVDANHEDLKGAVIKTLNTTNEPYSSTNGHGTGTAGIIGARKNNTGILSVAPDCQIIAIKALTESGSGSMTDIVEAINLAINEGVHVINMSLGGGAGTASLQAAVQKAAAAGIYVICSAGNSGGDNSVGYPARYPQAYAVGAINQSNKISAFSSRGDEVDIAAPGERVLTCWKNGGYATVSGTSFSAPYVSGCFALFVEAKIKMDLLKLKETAIDIEEPGEDNKSGYGLIQPYELIKKNTNMACAAPVLSFSAINENSVTISWPSVPGGFNYTVEYKRSDSQNWGGQQITRATSVALNNLSPNTNYDFRVKANCSTGISPFTQISAKTIGATPITCPKIDVVRNFATGSRSTSMEWSAPAGVKEYAIEYKKVSDSEFTILGNTTNNKVNLLDLVPGTDYTFRVKALCGEISGEYSSVTFKTIQEIDVAKAKEAYRILGEFINSLPK